MAPTTGVFVNESPPLCPPKSQGKKIKDNYDPRVIQKMMDGSGEKFQIWQNKGRFYAIPLSTGKKKSFEQSRRWSMKRKCKKTY